VFQRPLGRFLLPCLFWPLARFRSRCCCCCALARFRLRSRSRALRRACSRSLSRCHFRNARSALLWSLRKSRSHARWLRNRARRYWRCQDLYSKCSHSRYSSRSSLAKRSRRFSYRETRPIRYARFGPYSKRTPTRGRLMPTPTRTACASPGVAMTASVKPTPSAPNARRFILHLHRQSLCFHSPHLKAVNVPRT
jgi:hypothetical protein